jgi:hypothetical protein
MPPAKKPSLLNISVQRPPASLKAVNNLTGLDYNPDRPANLDDFRPGQLFMIQLRKLDPGFYDHITAQKQGCFYDSSKMEAVMRAWAQHLEDKGMERQIKIQRDEEKHKGAVRHLRVG